MEVEDDRMTAASSVQQFDLVTPVLEKTCCSHCSRSYEHLRDDTSGTEPMCPVCSLICAADRFLFLVEHRAGLRFRNDLITEQERQEFAFTIAQTKDYYGYGQRVEAARRPHAA
jgi:hypothetical protein